MKERRLIMSKVEIDFSRQTGRMKPMHAVNNGPFESEQSHLGTKGLFREAGFPCVRNNDASASLFYFGEHSNDVMFIFPNFDADENDPTNYDFFYTDRFILDTYEAGSTLLFRLGSKIEAGQKKYNTHPPKDYAKFARICEHIMAHYVRGWADGYKIDIPYWEIWNEADGFKPDGSSLCWQSTFEEFLKFYEIVAKHLKKCFPDQKIGGPAFTHSGERAGKRPYMREFLTYMYAHEVPLDFCSWHGYITRPEQNTDSAVYTRELLDEIGYKDTETVLDEWNYVRGWLRTDMSYSYVTMMNEKGAAFDTANMLAAQKSPIDLYMYYDARPDCSFNGLFAPYTFEPLKGFYSFWQFNKLYQLKNEVYSASEADDVYIGAARNEDCAAVQLARYAEETPEEGIVEVQMKNLPAQARVRCYVIDREHTNECLWEVVFDSRNAVVRIPVQSYASVLFTINEPDQAVEQ